MASLRKWPLLFLFVFYFSYPALAQDVREEARREAITQADLLRRAEDTFSAPGKAPVVEEEADQRPLPEEGPVFFIRRILIEGNTLFSEAELSSFARDFEGRTLSFRDLQSFADLITSHYWKRGYTASRAYIPPQKVTDATVIVRVLEARVGNVAVGGNRWFRERLYRDALPLESGHFFEMTELEQAIREINAKPDRTARAYLSPGKEAGTTDITLKAEDQFPFHAAYEFNLSGTKLTHRARHLIYLTDNNLLGLGDRIESNLALAEQGALLGSVMRYEFPWQRTGTLFHFGASMAKVRLQKHLRPLDVEGKAFSLVPGLTQTFFRTRHMKLDGEVRFEVKDSKTLVGDQKLSFDRMRVLVAGPQLSIYDRLGETLWGANVHVGIPEILGASSKHDNSASRVASGGEFVYGTMSAARLQKLPYRSFLVLQSSGQWSPEPLTALEQFYLGGMHSVRGYPENDSAGDNGYSFSAELRVPPYGIPESWSVFGMKDKTWRDAVSLVGFIEGGQVFNDERQVASSEKTRTLLGAGFGVRFYATPDLNMQFAMGFPFGDDSADKDRPQIHLSVRVGF